MLTPVTNKLSDRVTTLILRLGLFLSPAEIPEWWLNMLEETWFIPEPLERMKWSIGVLKEAVRLRSKMLIQN